MEAKEYFEEIFRLRLEIDSLEYHLDWLKSIAAPEIEQASKRLERQSLISKLDRLIIGNV